MMILGLMLLDEIGKNKQILSLPTCNINSTEEARWPNG